ncbi:nucleoside monophosphate kinase [Candidatus Woesebacteria bacterium]|nr:nucleoside monophosphate kinase [Candidatus Woesebacteria bacterium]
MAERVGGEERLDLGKRIILFIGAEGAGKSLHAEHLAKETGKPYITTGQIIRDLATNDPGPLGEECREMYKNKAYLAGPTLLRILVDRFAKDDTKDGFILDGGLRTIEETIDFRGMLRQAGRDIPLTVVYLIITEEETYRRLLDGPDARKRHDDTRESIASRLEKFKLNLKERLAVIKAEEGWGIIEIDAMDLPGKVYERVRASLKDER